MISFSPSFSFAEIIPLLKHKNSTESIQNIFCKNKKEKLFFFSRSSWAICSIALLKKKPCFFIPEYYCDEALFLLRKLNIKIIFYKINDDNSINIDDIKSKTKLNNPDIILFCNFFGKNIFNSYLYDLKKKYNSILIEDSTHSLIPNDSIGHRGDFVIYSPYKLIPIPMGSIMICRSNISEFRDIRLIDDNFFINKINNSTINIPSKVINFQNIFKWSIKQILKNLGISKINIELYESDYYIKSENELFHPSLDNFSKKLINFFLIDSKKILNKRDQMFGLICNIIKQKSIKFSKSINYNHSSSENYPYMVEIRGDQPYLKDFYNYLKKLNIPVLTWPTLPLEVKTKSKENELVIKKRNSKFYIPIHYQPKNFIKILSHKETNNFKFEFLKIENKDWIQIYKNCKKKNILNNIHYLNAQESILKIYNQKYKILLNGKIVAIFVLLKKKFLLLNIDRINRGPIFLDNNLNENIKINIIKEMTKFNSDKIFNFFKFSPEYLNINHNAFINYKSKNFIFDGNGWKSAIIDLNDNIFKIRQNLNQKWRNSLNAFEKKNVSIYEDNSNKSIDVVIKYYQELKKINNFRGIKTNFLKYFLENSNKKIYFAKLNEKFLGYICISIDDDTCTYLLGYANENGRKINVMNGLMWNVISDLKKKNFNYFDLGGLDNINTPGIFRFKSGLNAKNYDLIGNYQRVRIF